MECTPGFRCSPSETMTTSDGIATEDWDRVHALAVDVVNADAGEEPKSRHDLLQYLEALEAK
jgi:hypothetical protein